MDSVRFTYWYARVGFDLCHIVSHNVTNTPKQIVTSRVLLAAHRRDAQFREVERVHGALHAINEYRLLRCVEREVCGKVNDAQKTRGVAEFVWRRDSLPWLQCDHAVTVAEESFAIDVGMEDREGDDVRVADQHP